MVMTRASTSRRSVADAKLFNIAPSSPWQPSSSSLQPSTKTKNPRYVPPKDGRCMVNELPSELLAYVFELGTKAEWEEMEEDDDDDEDLLVGNGRKVQEDDGDEDFTDVSDEEEDKDDEVANMGKDEKKGEKDGDGTAAIAKAPSVNSDDEETELPFQVLVSHICKHWRTIALDTPQLWTCIGVDEASNIDELTEWLQRSKACPLDIDVDLDLDDVTGDLNLEAIYLKIAQLMHSGETADTAEENLRPVLAIMNAVRKLIEHVERWQKFCLQTTNLTMMLFVFYNIGMYSAGDDTLSAGAKAMYVTSAPMLELLWLSCNEADPDMEDARMMMALEKPLQKLFGGSAPALKDVSLWGVPFWYKMLAPRQSDSLSSQPTTQLRALELVYLVEELRPTYDDFVAILRGAPHLHTLKISESGVRLASLPTDGAVAPLRLPALRKLELMDLTLQDARHLVRLLHAPALQMLGLKFDEDDYSEIVEMLTTQPMVSDDTEWRSFSQVITRGSDASTTVPSGGEILLASVRELKLAGLVCSEDAMEALYRAAPRVEKLFLNMSGLTLPAATKLCAPWDDSTPMLLTMKAIAKGVNATTEFVKSMADIPFPSVVKLTPSTIPLPLLTELTVSGMRGPDLCALVAGRQGMQRQLHVLRIDRRAEERGEVEDADLAFLRRAAGKVEWVRVDTEDDDDEFEDDEEIDLLSLGDIEEEVDMDQDDEEEADEEDDDDDDAEGMDVEGFGEDEDDGWVDDVD